MQPGRSPAPFLLIAVVGAFALWTAWQNWPASDAATEETSQHFPSASRPALSQSDKGARVAGVFTNDDYPIDALNRNEQGTTHVRVRVDRRGRVANCSVIESSGSKSLDTAANAPIIAVSRPLFGRPPMPRAKLWKSLFDQSITWRIAD